MNNYQKLILIISVAIMAYLILAVPKYYHVYSPKKGHLYYETPVEGAKLEINYSAIIPKLVSVVLISFTLIIVFSKFKTPRSIAQKELMWITISFLIILILSIAHFGSFGNRDLHLLSNAYIGLASLIFVLWIVYFTFRKK